MVESGLTARVSFRTVTALEVVAVVVSVLVALWIVVPLYSGNYWLIAVPSLMALSLMIYSHRERAESLEEIGFTRKHFLHALRLLVAPMLAAALLLLLVGYWFKSMRNVDDVLLKLATLPLWGLVQQYVLQGFIYRRVREVVGRGLLPVVITAGVFALVHLPNLSLTVLSFAGGLVWTWAYERAPNLFALGISHGLMSLLVMTTLPAWMLPSFGAGYKYFH